MRVWLVPHCCDFLKTFLWETLRVFSFLVLQTSSNEQSLILLPGTTWVVLSSCKSGMSKLQSALQLQGPARNWLFFDRSDCCHLDILCRLRALQVIQAGLWVSWPRFLPQKTDTLETWDAFWMDFGLSKRTVSFFGATLKSSIVLVSTFFPCAHEFSLSSSPVGHVGFLVLKPEERPLHNLSWNDHSTKSFCLESESWMDLHCSWKSHLRSSSQVLQAGLLRYIPLYTERNTNVLAPELEFPSFPSAKCLWNHISRK